MRAALALALALALAGPARGAEDPKRLKARVEAAGKAIAAADAKIAGALGDIDAIDRRIAELGPKIAEAEAEGRRLAGEVRRAEAEIAQIDAEIARRRAAMNRRVRIAHRMLEGGWIRYLFAEGDFAGLGARIDALMLILRQDRGWIDRRKELLGARERARAELESLRRRNDENLGALKSLRAKAAGEKAERRTLVSKLRLDKKSLAAEQAKARTALERALARLTPVRRPAEGKGAVARLKGWFARPVKGRIVQEFGRGRGEKFARNGVIFSARPGETVLAAQDGVVLYSGWFKGYGQMLVLDHGSSLLSVYAHLERLLRKPGDGVLKSDPIGRAGDTGSTEGPGLYFEIRLRGQALNPVEWIRTD